MKKYKWKIFAMCTPFLHYAFFEGVHLVIQDIPLQDISLRGQLERKCSKT